MIRRARVRLAVLLTLFVVLMSCCTGLFFPTLGRIGSRTRVTRITYPLPHHVPNHPGNLTLRFAMVHDVIHERFPHHGPDYYQARNREAERRLPQRPAVKGKEADEYFHLLDDWAVGLTFLGQHQQAVERMRDKLKLQESLGYKGKELYSTYANLGTFLILWQLGEGVLDVPKAKKRIGESVQWVRKAIEVNPHAHFGRESWQVVLEEFLLAVLEKPELLLRFDMVGNRLDQPVEVASAVCFDREKWLHSKGQTSKRTYDFSRADQAVEYLRTKPSPDESPVPFRECIQRVGAEVGWNVHVKTGHKEPAAFDEPTLAIVGMWRMGAGANPHFALALGEIMLRVGQGYIAWTAYERAYQLREHLWPDASIQKRFGEHCRTRQRLIEQHHPEGDWPAFRRQFESELAFGQKYQKEYQEYEAAQIKNGVSVYDPNFDVAFEKGRAPIATPVGQEDQTFGRRSVTSRYHLRMFDVFAGGLLLAGVFAFVAALIVKLRSPQQ